MADLPCSESPTSPLLASPHPLSPASDMSQLFAQAPLHHSALTPLHQQSTQSQQIAHHYTDSHQSNHLPHAKDSETIDHSCKRARLDSSQDASPSLWAYAGTNKPVGIALPQILQKVETHESESITIPSKNDLFKIGEVADIKPSQSVGGGGERGKGEMKSSLTLGSCNEINGPMSKSFWGTNDRGNLSVDTTSNLEYPSKAMSDASDNSSSEVEADSVEGKRKLEEDWPGRGAERGGYGNVVYEERITTAHVSCGKEKGEIPFSSIPPPIPSNILFV